LTGAILGVDSGTISSNVRLSAVSHQGQ